MAKTQAERSAALRERRSGERAIPGDVLAECGAEGLRSEIAAAAQARCLEAIAAGDATSAQRWQKIADNASYYLDGKPDEADPALAAAVLDTLRQHRGKGTS